MQIKKLISKSEQNLLSKRTEFILLGLCLVIASSIFTYSTWGGLIWTSDSFHYWAASRSFAREGVFMSHGGGSYVYWPPLFPIILSFFTENQYHILQAIALNLSVISVYLYIRQIAGALNGIFTTLLFCLSIFPYLISTFLWSELFFMIFMYFGAFFHTKWLQSGQLKYLLLAATLLSLMCLQRNAGILIMIGATIYYLISYTKTRDYKNLAKSGLAILIIVLPNVLWNLLHLSTNKDYDILSQNYFSNIAELIFEGLTAISKAIAPQVNEFFSILLGLSLLLIAIKQLPTLASYVLIVYLLILLIFPSSHYGITDRFLAPIIPLILFSFTNAFWTTYVKRNRILKNMYLLILILTVSYNCTRTFLNVSMWHERSITNPKAAKIFF